MGRDGTQLAPAHVHDLLGDVLPIDPIDARAAFTRSMAQREEMEIAELYRRALRRMPATIDGVPPLAVPTECPVTLEELLAEPTK